MYFIDAFFINVFTIKSFFIVLVNGKVQIPLTVIYDQLSS